MVTPSGSTHNHPPPCRREKGRWEKVDAGDSFTSEGGIGIKG
jgi:hypothetical protein